MSKKTIQNWGNFPKIMSDVIELHDYEKLIGIVKKEKRLIARGNGRCYGDSSLQTKIISTLKMNKILSFDKNNGIIKVEAGIQLSEILEIIVPAGFFLPVSPGTKWITMGGAIASNVHGKNHHKEGAISNYIVAFDLLNEQGEIVNCCMNENSDEFINTLGGMGITGIITTATIKLKPIQTAYIKQKTLKADNIGQILDYFDQYNDYTYSVAWIDCLKKGKKLGRSILMLGEHATEEELKQNKTNYLSTHSKKQINIPFYLPNFTLNKWTIKLFNNLFYNKQLSKESNSIVHYDKFFYPLDVLNNWNKIYGKNGFTQYQFVIPFKNGREGLENILDKITKSGSGSFLAVLKTFGKKDPNTSPLSFPMEGYTLALDFKLNNKTLKLLDELDELVLKYNGKLYLTKDVRMSKEMFNKTYSVNLLKSKFSSLQSDRLYY